MGYIKHVTLLCFALSAIALYSYFRTDSYAFNAFPASLNSVYDKAGVDHFVNLVISEEDAILNAAVIYIDTNWETSFEPMLIESIYFTQNRTFSKKLLHLLARKTGKDFGADLDRWHHWLWNKNTTYTKKYFEFKAKVHQFIDPKFYKYFADRADQSTIRLDEVIWGGVLQDGIPPLRNPQMIKAGEAQYLKDNNVVFGIEVNGDARAYPKRILAWHEMFVDTVGDVPVAGVYCTLCGTVILYKTKQNGVNHTLGTSGFLYRSNKLMYDKETQSLWSTLEGEPVIGPLVGKEIKLEYLSVVTTTWGEWKRRHPDTSVLSLNTGHRRDYGEGVAYQQYFATDDLMFNIPEIDTRLNNKDEILAIRIPEKTATNLAISSKFLRKNPIYTSKLGPVSFAVFTDKTGAHRVYDTGGLTFTRYDRNSEVIDSMGIRWTLYENEMVSDEGKKLIRIPTHNAFWFGYQAAFPETTLIK
ncbi:MAG: DUF3179 domain-containing protein [Flavobacteriaceae bacterium]